MNRLKTPLWLQVTLSGLFLLYVGWEVLDRVLQPIESQIASIDTRLQAEGTRAGNAEERLNELISELNVAVGVATEASRHLETAVMKFDARVAGLDDKLDQIDGNLTTLASDFKAADRLAQDFYVETRQRLIELAPPVRPKPRPTS